MSSATRAVLCVSTLAAVAAGCSATSRHKALTTFFDGVPPLKTSAAEGATPSSTPSLTSAGRPVAKSEHGPYAAKLCSACHDAAATNALVAPKEELCIRCHDLKLDSKYVHGPLASGGCLLCHDPHGTPYRALLVSASDGFCFRCHDRASVLEVEAHKDLDPSASCTVCHNAHGSDKRYLLR